MTDNTTKVAETTVAGTDPIEPDSAQPDSGGDDSVEKQAPNDSTVRKHPDRQPLDNEPKGPRTSRPKSSGRSISIAVRSLVVWMLTAALVAGVGTLAWLYVGAERKLSALAAESNNNARAEKMALDYAVNAATMDFNHLQDWKVKLVAGTSPELNKKLSEAGDSMQQILVPLQWTSTAQPLVASVRSSSDGVYVVDSFVSVKTKTVQSGEPLQSTATYSVTIDSKKDWQITDVGGVGAVVGN
ncbi:hypothetical protein ACWDTP_14375 [Mycobacterium sp. NPDC003449]